MQIANSGDFYGFWLCSVVENFAIVRFHLLPPFYNLYKKNKIIVQKKISSKKSRPIKTAFSIIFPSKTHILVFCHFSSALFATTLLALNLIISIHFDLAFLFIIFLCFFLASKKALSSEFLKDPYNAWWVIIAAAFFTELRYAFL